VARYYRLSYDEPNGRLSAGKGQSEQISSALPLIAIDEQTSRIGSSVPIAELGSYRRRIRPGAARLHSRLPPPMLLFAKGLTQRLPTGRLLLSCYLC
jgi:hypothetical protein